MAKGINWDKANKVSKKNTQGIGFVSDELPVAGSYADRRRYQEIKGDELSIPNPLGPSATRGPKIIVVKGGRLNRKRNKPQKKQTSSKAKTLSQSNDSNSIKAKTSMSSLSITDQTRVKQIEIELIQKAKFINFINLEKSGKKSCQKLLREILGKLQELIGIDPTRVDTPLSPELEKAYAKLRSVV